MTTPRSNATDRASAQPVFPGAATRRDPLTARIRLGAQLRAWRRAAGLSPAVAGGIIGASADAIERIENDHGPVAESHVAALLTSYAVTDPGDVAQVWDLVRRANRPRWWQPDADLVPIWFERFLDLEQACSSIRGYECQWVPGLLQTRDYIRALISIEHTEHTAIQRRVTLRLRRQALLTAPDPPTLWAVIDEAALRRPLGGPQVQRAQLTHLIEQTDHPNITLQIAAFARGGHPAAGGSFTLLTHPDDPGPTPTTSAAAPDGIAYVEHLTGASYLDTPADVRHYTAVMDRLTAQLDPPEATAGILAAIRAQL